MKENAPRLALWKTRFARGYGPSARLGNEGMILTQHYNPNT